MRESEKQAAAARAARALHGLSQGELAALTGLRVDKIRAVEHGRVRYSGPVLLKICNALGLAVEEWQQLQAMYAASSGRRFPTEKEIR